MQETNGGRVGTGLGPPLGLAYSVSVVVPTCGRMDLLDRCLDALTRQTLPPAPMR